MIECDVILNSAVLLLFHLLMYSKPLSKLCLLSKICLALKYLAMFRCGDPIDSTCLQLVGAHCACIRSFKPITGPLWAGDICLQIGLSDKRSYWLKLTSLRNSYSRFRQWTCWAFPYQICPPCGEGNRKECNSNNCDLSVLFYEIHAWNVT